MLVEHQPVSPGQESNVQLETASAGALKDSASDTHPSHIAGCHSSKFFVSHDSERQRFPKKDLPLESPRGSQCKVLHRYLFL